MILLNGATGYVGGRLLAELVNAGYRVRCLARRPEHLRPRAPAGVEQRTGLRSGTGRPSVALLSSP